jgi:hypothetical protein
MVNILKFIPLYYSTAMSIAKALGSDNDGSGMAFYLLNIIILCKFHSWETEFFQLLKMLWVSSSKLHLSTFIKPWWPWLYFSFSLHKFLLLLFSLFVQRLLIFSFRYCLLLFQICVIISYLTLFRLSPFGKNHVCNKINLISFFDK